MRTVPNRQPTIELPQRIAIIGDFPSEDDELMGQPFVGRLGNILQGVMAQMGILPQACLIGNFCQVRHSMGKPIIERLTNDYFKSRAALKADIERYDPNICVLLGSEALKEAGISFSADDYRGSMFVCRETDSAVYGRNCLATYHPREVIRDYGRREETTDESKGASSAYMLPLFQFDLQRALEKSTSKDLNLPVRKIEVNLTAQEIIDRLDALPTHKLIGCDIEGGIPNPKESKAENRNLSGITCISFAETPLKGFTIDFHKFSIPEKMRILQAVCRFMLDDNKWKVFQNGLYDLFCLQWLWRIHVRGVKHDTMVGWWELYPELPKALAVQSSVCTEEPYYKNERTMADKETHLIYCAKDSCVTLEIAEKQIQFMTKGQQQHFHFNMELMPLFNYMELRGIKYNYAKAQARCHDITEEMSMINERMNQRAKCTVNPNTNNGPNSLANILYKRLGFAPQYKMEKGRRTNNTTADVNALLNLTRKYPGESFLFDILKWRQLEGQRKQLMILPDRDGRVRGAYNVCGTDTGRLSCYGSPTGSGTNLQTIMEKLRDCYEADDDMVMFQCDLSGADGWTVAAWCNHLGDSTMMDDYRAKIKPAKVIAAMRQFGMGISQLPQAELLEWIKKCDMPDWLYFTCKRVQHGTNYMMGKMVMSQVILKDSWKLLGEPIFVLPRECENLQALYSGGRYKAITSWQNYVKNELIRNQALSCASTHIREFCGDVSAHETIKSALSQEPQHNTTYATNRAAHALWHDRENWSSTGRPIIEPLHQVHDAVIGQFPRKHIEWASDKIRQYFGNTLRIAHQDIIIPFEGAYGPTWYNCKEGKCEGMI